MGFTLFKVKPLSCWNYYYFDGAARCAPDLGHTHVAPVCVWKMSRHMGVDLRLCRHARGLHNFGWAHCWPIRLFNDYHVFLLRGSQGEASVVVV